MITMRKAEDRGPANFGWLNSFHTFSFGNYYDPKHMGFSHLRVINDDTVSPGAGFDTHGHKDMEIISLVLQGRIAHKDSAGNVEELPAGEFQLMSAGKGIYHSEFNASEKDTLKFLQIWIQPNVTGGAPGYQQKAFGEAQGITTVITPDGANGTLSIKQNASLSQLILAPQTQDKLTIEAGRNVYIHQIEGELSLNNGTTLKPGDGAKITKETALDLKNTGQERVKAIIFDLE
ncbi:pirin family protein [Marinomonas transparens]|uniref:Pirin family protein n=1 Tax=Marinomonas transparens TaxID=2795388 RepID=A0A934JW55_9GAMM|nr:pirin family protein [Marinomonas transparens]MBJ7538309.1 pirin family protein [Marinomonas transparens]